MINSVDWDWAFGDKAVETADWVRQCQWVEELYVSPDGESVAAIVNVDDESFNVCVDGRVWGEPFEKIWHLRFTADNRPFALVSKNGLWTVAVEGRPWSRFYDYVWNPVVSPDGRRIVVTAQQDGRYAMAGEDQSWPADFFNIDYPAIGFGGNRTAAVVQVDEFESGQVPQFQKGVFSVAVDGIPWDVRFVNAWHLTFSRDEQHVAAEVRLNLYDYTIALDGRPWPQVFACVWAPCFHPGGSSLVAPVRRSGQWYMVQDGQTIWDRPFFQLWQQQFNTDGSCLAAIGAPAYGHWTVIKDGEPWQVTFDEMVTDLTFSLDGNHIAALGKTNGRWTVVVDGQPWQRRFDMVWQPVFSPDGKRVAVMVEREKKYAYVINDRICSKMLDAAWPPQFSPDGQRLLLRFVDQGFYHRRVVPVADLFN